MRSQARKPPGVEDLTGVLASGAQTLGLQLTDDALESLMVYFFELERWSRKMNLIGRQMPAGQIIENHFLDSLTLLPALGSEKVHLLDVGSGAGFPGLVCKTARRDIELMLVEPRLKRVSFLRHIVRTLGLKQVEVLAGRVEDETLACAGTVFSHITSRAVTDIAAFLDMIGPFIHPGVQVICMKGSKWESELDLAAPAIETHSMTLAGTLHFQLPFSGAERALLILQR